MMGVQIVAAGSAPLAPRSLVAKRIGHMSVWVKLKELRLSTSLPE
jgi:hypothetical protein